MAQPALMKLKVKCLKSDDFEINIDCEASVDDLKEEIQNTQNIEPTKQRLIYKGRVLKSEKKLKDYKISDGVTIHLIIRKQAVTNPQNDEPTPANSTNTNTNNNTAPTIPGATSISVAVVDGTNGTADVNSILNSVLSGFGGNNDMNPQAMANSIQSAMNQNPSGVMNLRGLLNPGDDPDAPNDDDVSSVDNDDINTPAMQRILPELQPQFAVRNRQGGYSPVTLLPPVLRSCNAINLELDRLQRNYNRDVMGIRTDDDNIQQQQQQQDAMNIDPQQQPQHTQSIGTDNADVDVEVEVQSITTDAVGNIVATQSSSRPQINGQNAATTAAPQSGTGTRRRREYLNMLLDTWDRYNEIVNGVDDGMGMNVDAEDDDMEMKGNGDGDGDEEEYKGVMGFVDSVFDELVDYQNTIESGLNIEEKRNDDNDGDMEVDMKENGNNEELKGYTKEQKDALSKKTKCAGDMLVEIGTVLASIGHMINKMDIHRKTPRNRLRITGLSGISHVVRTAVPVEISTIVSRMPAFQQQLQQLRQPQNAQNQPSQPPQPPQPQPQSQQNGASNAAQNSNNNNDTSNTQSASNGNTANNENNTNQPQAQQGQNLLSSLLDSFAGAEQKEDSMDVDETDNTTNNAAAPSTTSTASTTANTGNAPANPMSALLNAFGGGGSGGANPLASLMSAFTGNANRNNNRNDNNNNNDSAQQRNPLMLINRTFKFLLDTVSISELQMSKSGDYSFIASHQNALRSFILNTILGSNDTPMRRHEIAMDYANGFGLYMISQFSSERRDVIRSLTLGHFRNYTPSLIDIILDSNSETIFAQKLIEWIKTAFSSWIYKLSLKYNDRLQGVKKLFIRLLLNSAKYLNANEAHLRIIPELVTYFVDNAKSYHLKQMQKQHQQQQSQPSSQQTSAMSNRYNRNTRNDLNEQWVNNVEDSERDRWLETIRCDQKRIKQCLADMKSHEFSNSYLPPSSSNDKANDKNKNKKNDSQ